MNNNSKITRLKAAIDLREAKEHRVEALIKFPWLIKGTADETELIDSYATKEQQDQYTQLKRLSATDKYDALLSFIEQTPECLGFALQGKAIQEVQQNGTPEQQQRLAKLKLLSLLQ